MIRVFTGTVSVKLLVPIKWEDKEIKTVDLDFSKMCGKITEDCHKETFNNASASVILPASCPEYCRRIASAISGLEYRIFEKMNSYDYDLIWNTVGAFINKRNPQKFYDEAVKLMEEADGEEEPEVFTKPAKKPE